MVYNKGCDHWMIHFRDSEATVQPASTRPSKLNTSSKKELWHCGQCFSNLSLCSRPQENGLVKQVEFGRPTCAFATSATSQCPTHLPNSVGKMQHFTAIEKWCVLTNDLAIPLVPTIFLVVGPTNSTDISVAKGAHGLGTNLFKLHQAEKLSVVEHNEALQ